ncbi:MAG: NUDIX domain-containing protein [Gammaproteobacteria bacterium]
MTAQPAPARPSASVVVARDGAAAIEILLLRRNEQVAFHGGAWVFPGGRVDDADRARADEPELATARRAAVREAHEETGLALTEDTMWPFAHWTTPVDLPKRFATWFFATPVTEAAEVRVDNSEIVDYQWVTPAAALALHAAGELTLPAPTYVTLLGFRDLANVGALAARLRDITVQRFLPRLAPIEGGRCTLYQEDAGYETLSLDAPGPRHRLLMVGNDWQYVRAF